MNWIQDNLIVNAGITGVTIIAGAPPCPWRDPAPPAMKRHCLGTWQEEPEHRRVQDEVLSAKRAMQELTVPVSGYRGPNTDGTANRPPLFTERLWQRWS